MSELKFRVIPAVQSFEVPTWSKYFFKIIIIICVQVFCNINPTSSPSHFKMQSLLFFFIYFVFLLYSSVCHLDCQFPCVFKVGRTKHTNKFNSMYVMVYLLL